MNKLFLKKGLTLIELLVAIVLMSIVLLGIFAINNVLNNNNQDYGQRYLVKSETQATLNNILQSANSAIGDASGANPAFLVGAGAVPGMNDANSFCIHQVTAGTPFWACYTWTPATYQINYCAESYNTALPYDGAVPCVALNLGITSGPTFVGTAAVLPIVPPVPTGQSLFTITITNCLNNSPTCSTTQTDPVNNPFVTLSGTAIPAQVSTG